LNTAMQLQTPANEAIGVNLLSAPNSGIGILPIVNPGGPLIPTPGGFGPPGQ
jgi:hypothetical protein